jgi:hypothetical protein
MLTFGTGRETTVMEVMSGALSLDFRVFVFVAPKSAPSATAVASAVFFVGM